jgi:hypothetical protein
MRMRMRVRASMCACECVCFVYMCTRMCAWCVFKLGLLHIKVRGACCLVYSSFRGKVPPGWLACIGSWEAACSILKHLLLFVHLWLCVIVYLQTKHAHSHTYAHTQTYTHNAHNKHHTNTHHINTHTQHTKREHTQALCGAA